MERSSRLERTHTQNVSYPNFEQKLNFTNTTSGGHHSRNMAETPCLLDGNLRGAMNSKQPPLVLGLKRSSSAMEGREDTWHDMERSAKQCNSSRGVNFQAANVSARLLNIGKFNFMAKYAADLLARFQFKRRKFLWEIFDRSQDRKFRVEVPWDNILAMRAVLNDNGPEILEIELEHVPKFHIELDSEPPKKTSWDSSKEDVTGGHAIIYRIHRLEFAPGDLTKHYQKILLSDERLMELSQQPFPSLASPYFGAPLLSEDITDYNPLNKQFEISTLEAEEIFNALLMPPSSSHSNPPPPHTKEVANGNPMPPEASYQVYSPEMEAGKWIYRGTH